MVKRYPKEVQEAIAQKHWQDGQTMSSLSRENNISMTAIKSWVKKYAPVSKSESPELTIEDFNAIKAENRQLQEDNEILRRVISLMDKYSKDKASQAKK